MVKIRQIEDTDNANVARMIRNVFEEFGARTQGTVYTDPTTDRLYELFKTDNSALFIAVKAGEVVGCCGIFPTHGLPDQCAELVKFYVSGTIRGTGVGRKLYERSEKFAKEVGFNQLYIESTPDFIQAVRIYEKIGFKALEQPLGNSGHFGCNIWMLKAI